MADEKKDKSGDVVVKVFRSGSKGVEVALNGGRTIDDALKAAGQPEVEDVTETIDRFYVNLQDMEPDKLEQLRNHGTLVYRVPFPLLSRVTYSNGVREEPTIVWDKATFEELASPADRTGS